MAFGGMRQWNTDTGALVLDTQRDLLNRTFGAAVLPAGAGSLSDDRFLAGMPYAFAAPDGAFSMEAPKRISFSGNTMYWTAGASMSVMYGVGPGVSTYNPPSNGTRAGFRCRNIDTGYITIDESMFALQLIAKGYVNVPGTLSIDVNVPDGALPCVAIRSPGNSFIFLRTVAFVNTTTCRITFGATQTTDCEYWVFGRVQPSMTKGIGARWWDTSTGVLRGDTSIPIMRVLSPNEQFDLYPNQGRSVVGPAGRKIAILLNHGGFYLYKTAAAPGPGAGNVGAAQASVYRAGVRTPSDNEITLSTCLYAGAGAAGTTETRTMFPAFFTTVDVTGI